MTWLIGDSNHCNWTVEADSAEEARDAGKAAGLVVEYATEWKDAYGRGSNPVRSRPLSERGAK